MQTSDVLIPKIIVRTCRICCPRDTRTTLRARMRLGLCAAALRCFMISKAVEENGEIRMAERLNRYCQSIAHGALAGPVERPKLHLEHCSQSLKSREPRESTPSRRSCQGLFLRCMEDGGPCPKTSRGSIRTAKTIRIPSFAVLPHHGQPDGRGVEPADVAFYFCHWLTDLAGAEPYPQEPPVCMGLECRLNYDSKASRVLLDSLY